MQYSELENSHIGGAQDHTGEQQMKTKVSDTEVMINSKIPKSSLTIFCTYRLLPCFYVLAFLSSLCTHVILYDHD